MAATDSPTSCIVPVHSIVAGSPVTSITGCNRIGRCIEGMKGHSTGFGCTTGCNRIAVAAARLEERLGRRHRRVAIVGPCTGWAEGSSCSC